MDDAVRPTRPMIQRPPKGFADPSPSAVDDPFFGVWDESLPTAPRVRHVDTLPGTIHGRYETLGILGSGATSTVYEVHDTVDNCHRALKVLELQDEVSLVRFQREAAVLARLRHPSIVRVHAEGAWGGRHYLVLEIVHGTDLLSWIRSSRQPMEHRRVARLFRDVALGLHEAHEAGVIHRDIKLGNLVLQELHDGTERLRVVDFGLAHPLDSRVSITLANTVLGTPSYMAPERITSSERPSPSWDVYGLGVVLYELLTRRALFRRKSLAETMRAIERDVPVPVRERNPRVPRVFDQLVSEMMEKDPGRRPGCCHEVAMRLQELATA